MKNRPGQWENREARLALRDAAAGVYSQMYYWGRDVPHPDGNLLMAYGFTRIAKTGAKGTSRYRLPWNGGLVELHGFCAGWYPGGDEPGIVFHRPLNAWMLWRERQPPDPASLAEIFGRNRGKPHDIPALVEKAGQFMEWIWKYESWALKRWGLHERRAHHATYLKLRPRRWWLSPELSLKWMRRFADNPLRAPRPKSLKGTVIAARPERPPQFSARRAA
jgi:hypothetical protein